MPEARDLVRRTCRLLPSIGDVEPEAVRIAFGRSRAITCPPLDLCREVSGYYLAVTHSGVTMSPFLGTCVADEIMRGQSGRSLPISVRRDSSIQDLTVTWPVSGPAIRNEPRKTRVDRNSERGEPGGT